MLVIINILSGLRIQLLEHVRWRFAGLDGLDYWVELRSNRGSATVPVSWGASGHETATDGHEHDSIERTFDEGGFFCSNSKSPSPK